MEKQNDVFIPEPAPETKQRWLHEKQNLMRKYSLFQHLLCLIEQTQNSYIPIFNEDKELLYLTENLKRRLKEIEEKLNMKEDEQQ